MAKSTGDSLLKILKENKEFIIIVIGLILVIFLVVLCMNKGNNKVEYDDDDVDEDDDDLDDDLDVDDDDDELVGSPGDNVDMASNGAAVGDNVVEGYYS